MRTDRSLDSIDLTKLTIFSMIFIFFMLVMVFFVALPVIDRYKQAVEINNEKDVNLAKIEQIYSENLATYENLNLQNKKALDLLKNSFNEMKFISLAGKYFSNLYLSRANIIDSDPRYIISQINLTATMKSPQNLYDFIMDSKNYDNLIKIDFPIEMSSKDDYIETSFMIKIYQER
ncbi:hypothetical protein V2I28_07230 [Campylobacter sp. CX2-4080-23]|uniref:hypothetical protein n=1 Tax=Campylobacter porcelli TaxID=1660073 RepID=UPI002EC11F17|nr:hypothetical protein [Campylobacter sp. CX2-4080-23]